MRCGELCKSCVTKCQGVVSEKQTAEIECPMCGGESCEHCDDGYYTVAECPTKYVGGELLADIGIVSASEYHLPVAGGLLDQSAWWFELRQELRSEEANIQNEQHKRRSS